MRRGLAALGWLDQQDDVKNAHDEEEPRRDHGEHLHAARWNRLVN